jgi:hypothetical protein
MSLVLLPPSFDERHSSPFSAQRCEGDMGGVSLWW